MKNIILKLIGGVSFALGVLGAFLPLLPTTCFMLLATWAFSKSSPRFHAWLYCHSPFSTSIQNWHKHHVIPVKVKLMASLSLVSSFGLTAIFLTNQFILVSLGFSMAILLAFLITRPSVVDEKLVGYTTGNYISE